MQKSLADFFEPILKSKKRKPPNAEICDNSTDYCSTSKVLNAMSSKDNEPQASEISRLSEEGNEAKLILKRCQSLHFFGSLVFDIIFFLKISISYDQ